MEMVIQMGLFILGFFFVVLFCMLCILGCVCVFTTIREELK